LISIAISALSTGFTAAVFTFDFDVDPGRRKATPNFYGMVPDEPTGRTSVFVCLMLNTTLLLLIRSLGAAMIIAVSGRYFFVYTAIDHGIFWLKLLATNDAWLFLNFQGPSSIPIMIRTKTAFKVILDYTGLVQFRGPGVVGGLYYSFSTAMAFVASFVFIHMYFKRGGEDDIGEEQEDDEALEEDGGFDEGAGLNEKTVFTIAASISGAWALVFGLLLCTIKRKYVKTFTSTQTSHAWVKEFFLEGATDEVKSQIVEYNPRCWWSIRPQVREWLAENWDRWEVEKPDWFNDVWLSSVDDDMMPADALRRLRQKGGGTRRRSTFAERMGGSVRERRESASVVPAVDGDIEAGGISAGDSAASPASPRKGPI
jgi:hypothetical protein